jgi:hypothetical protein
VLLAACGEGGGVGKGSRKGSSAGRDGLSGPKFTTSGRMSVDSPRISSMSELKYLVDLS